MRGIFLFGCAFYFLVGVIHISIGSLTPYFIDYFDKQPDELAVLIFFQFIGFLNGVLLSPIIIRKYSHFKSLTVGLIVMILILGGFFLTKEWGYIIIMAFLLGYGAGTLETTMGSFIIAKHENNAESMSKLEVFFGLGAFIFPIVINLFIGIENWFLPFYLIFFFLLIILIGWIVFLSSLRRHYDVNSENMDVSNIKIVQYFTSDQKKLKQLILFVFFAFLYAGIETNFANFLPVIMINQGFENYSLISVSCFWMGIVFGRIAIGFLSKNLNFPRYLLFSCLCLIILLTIFPYIHHPLLQLANIFFIALSISGIFPIALTLASIIIQKYVDEVTSIFIAAASLGGALISFLIGWSLEKEILIFTFGIFAIMSLILIWISIKIKNSKIATNNSVQEHISK